MRHRGARLGAFALAATLFLTACGSAPRATEPADHHHDTTGGNVDLNDYLADAGLDDLNRASDLVVFGRVAGATSGVRIGTYERAEYTVLTIAVAEVLKGQVGRRSTVEVAMLTRLDGSAMEFGGRPVPTVGDRGVWMLRPIAAEFGRRGYVLTNQSAQFLFTSDGTAAAASTRPAREVRQLGDLARVLEHLRAVNA